VNYRHIYHAGNFADVFKHVVLLMLLEQFQRKETPYCYVDTHAGAGLYDLASEQALKTNEAAEGILRLLKASDMPEPVAAYCRAVQALNERQGAAADVLHWYPGSPWLARFAARPQDRLALCELHPETHAALKENFRRDRQVQIQLLDAYTAMRALLPPKERRGMVLIDPPFERTDEFAAIVTALTQAVKRWQGGTYAIWYPIKQREPVKKFYSRLKNSGIRNIFVQEFIIHPELTAERLNGCGMVIVNPPWQLPAQLATAIPWLIHALAPDGGEAPSFQLVGE